MWAATGLLPDQVRKALDWKWTKSDAVRFTLFSRTLRGIFSILPRKVRMVPIAERAFKKAEAAQ